jgi:hypothetical protein
MIQNFQKADHLLQDMGDHAAFELEAKSLHTRTSVLAAGFLIPPQGCWSINLMKKK